MTPVSTAAMAALLAISLAGSGAALAQAPAVPPAYNMPPPAGMQPSDMTAETSPEARAQDDQYSYAAEQWAAQNCIARRADNTAAGAVIGGLLGAVAGGSLAGRHDTGAGIVAGGLVGAVAGGAVGNAASPTCPPGYAMRAGAAPFVPGPVYGPVVYAAPDWYDPWVWYGGHWIYRPYPYHRFWFRTHGFGHHFR